MDKGDRCKAEDGGWSTLVSQILPCLHVTTFRKKYIKNNIKKWVQWVKIKTKKNQKKSSNWRSYPHYSWRRRCSSSWWRFSFAWTYAAPAAFWYDLFHIPCPWSPRKPETSVSCWVLKRSARPPTKTSHMPSAYRKSSTNRYKIQYHTQCSTFISFCLHFALQFHQLYFKLAWSHPLKIHL